LCGACAGIRERIANIVACVKQINSLLPKTRLNGPSGQALW
jgi:hypothetical protein